MRKVAGVLGIAALVLVAVSRAQDASGPAWVTTARIAHADLEPQNWPSSGRDYSEQRFSPLKAIDAANVGELGLAWYYDLDTHRGQEATPLIVDGVMYTTSAWSKVQALNAATGQLLWQFDPQVPGDFAIHACCDLVNRGVAAWQGRLYVGTLDGRLIALDASTGQPVWSVLTVDPKRPYTITGAPLAVDGHILIGNAGAEYGVRGYVSAYDAKTGALVWRFYTVPGNPEQPFESPALARAARTWSGQWWQDGGGATVWNALAYDPELGLVYFGTGNGSPWARKLGSGPRSDNLFSASIIAVHAATGTYAWHYQTTPGDIWDYDSTQTLTLATLTLGGEPRRVIMQAAKNGFFYVLDRATGQLLSAHPFVPVNWASGIDPKSGRPQVRKAARYDESGEVWVGAPGAAGAHNWQPMSYSAATGLVYIPAQELPFPYLRDPNFVRHGLAPNMGLDQAKTSLPQEPALKAQALAGLKGYLLAWDPVAGRERWRAAYPGPWNGGLLSTAGNLVFQGSAAGDFTAYRASDGKKLWSFAAQTGVIAAPVTFAVEGTQYVTVLAGWGGVFPLVAGELSFKSGRQVNRSRILTFAIGAHAELPAPPRPTLNVTPPPTTVVDPTLANEGAALYARRCGACHGDAAVSGGLVPDLRYSPALSNDALWRAVVEEGVLAPNGMVAFKTELSRRQQDAVRSFLIQRAQQSYGARTK